MMLRTASGSDRAGEHAAQRREDQRAAEDAEIVAAAAGDARAAEHDDGDRGEQVGLAHVVVGLRGEAGEQQADERRAEAAQHIGERR